METESSILSDLLKYQHILASEFHSLNLFTQSFNSVHKNAIYQRKLRLFTKKIRVILSLLSSFLEIFTDPFSSSYHFINCYLVIEQMNNSAPTILRPLFQLFSSSFLMPYSLVAISYISHIVGILTTLEQSLQFYFKNFLYPKLLVIVYPTSKDILKTNSFDFGLNSENKTDPIYFFLKHRFLSVFQDCSYQWMENSPSKDILIIRDGMQCSLASKLDSTKLDKIKSQASLSEKIVKKNNKIPKFDLQSFLDFDSSQTHTQTDLIQKMLDSPHSASHRTKRAPGGDPLEKPPRKKKKKKKKKLKQHYLDLF